MPGRESLLNQSLNKLKIINSSNRQQEMSSDEERETWFRNTFSIQNLETLKTEHPEIYEASINQELNRKVQYVNSKGEVLVAEPVEILNRQALCFILKEKYTEVYGGRIRYNKQPFQLFFLDGKDFASYNIRDINGNLGGDYVINLMADKLKIAAKHICNNLNITENQILVARLGGDEFVLLFTGIIPDNFINVINNAINHFISEINAEYYDSNNEIKTRRVEMKNNRVQSMRPPEDKRLCDIFFYYISQNMIFDKFGLDKVVADLHTDSDTEGPFLPEPDIEYPETCTNRNKKLQYLATRNPIYSKTAYQAILLDRAKQTTRFTDTVFAFYNNLVLNPLYGKEVLNFINFVERIKKFKNKIIITFDFKLLKEINNQLNEGRGNMYLKQGFEEIVLESVKGIVSESILYGTRRGNFHVAIEQGPSGLDQNLFDKVSGILNSLTNKGVDFQIGSDSQHSINLFFGFSMVYLDAEISESQDRSEYTSDADAYFERLSAAADDMAYFRLIDQILSGKVNLNTMNQLLDEKTQEPGHRTDIKSLAYSTIENMLDIHFTSPISVEKFFKEGKLIPRRFYERCRKLINLCNLYMVGAGSNKKNNVEPAEIIKYFEKCIKIMDKVQTSD